MDAKPDGIKVVFTPQDEPYLGRRALYAFDQLIVACMEVNALVAPRTHKIEMFNKIGGDKFPNCGPEMTQSLNSLTHGDPDSAMWNLVATGEDSVGHAASKILNRPDLCDKISRDAAVWISVLLAMMHAIFPEPTAVTQ